MGDYYQVKTGVLIDANAMKLANTAATAAYLRMAIRLSHRISSCVYRSIGDAPYLIKEPALKKTGYRKMTWRSGVVFDPGQWPV